MDAYFQASCEDRETRIIFVWDSSQMLCVHEGKQRAKASTMPLWICVSSLLLIE